MNEEINKIKQDVSDLQVKSIQKNINPETYKNLVEIVVKGQENRALVTDTVNAIIATLPTQTYSTASPSGSAVTGSIWFRNTGTLATNEIHMYSGTAWVQIK